MTATGGAKFDTHAHVWAADESRYPWMPVPPATGIPERPCPVESLIEAMDSVGVTNCVLVQPSSYGWRNEHVLDTVSEHPGRFLAVVLVDPADPKSPRTLRQLATMPGVRGVRFHMLDQAQATMFCANGPTLCRAAFASALVVTIQTAPQFLGVVDDVLRGMPEPGPTVIDHMGLVQPGNEDGAERLISLARQPSVLVKLSGAEVISRQEFPFLDCAPLTRAVVERFGLERVMWGSNFPHVLHRCSMSQVAELVQELLPDLSGLERSMIEYQTARRLWVDAQSTTTHTTPGDDGEQQ